MICGCCFHMFLFQKKICEVTHIFVFFSCFPPSTLFSLSNFDHSCSDGASRGRFFPGVPAEPEGRDMRAGDVRRPVVRRGATARRPAEVAPPATPDSRHCATSPHAVSNRFLGGWHPNRAPRWGAHLPLPVCTPRQDGSTFVTRTLNVDVRKEKGVQGRKNKEISYKVLVTCGGAEAEVSCVFGASAKKFGSQISKFDPKFEPL